MNDKKFYLQNKYFILIPIFILFFCINSKAVYAQINYPDAVQVNSTIDGHQDSPEIAVNGVGTVLVVFESGANGPDENIFAVSYDRKTFREFYQTGPTTDTASLEALPDDERFIVAWEQNGKVQLAIISCKDDHETFIVEPRPVRNDIYAFGKRPDVAISRDGSLFVIGWHNNDVVMQFFDSSGSTIGNLISVADVVENKQAEISLKFFPDSTLIVTWYSEKNGNFGSSSKDRDIWFQLFDCRPVWDGGEPIPLFETQKRANGDFTSDDPVWNDQEFPEVDVFDDGRFVIMWQDFPYSSGGNGTDGSGKGAYFRIFNQDGTPQTDDLLISEHTISFQKDADIRIRQSDKTIHFIYEDAYESTPEKNWLAYPSYRAFDDLGDPLNPSFELSDRSYGTDCRIAITEADAQAQNLILCVWETKDIENYDGSGRAVIFRDYSNTTSVEQIISINSSTSNHFQIFQNFPNPFNSRTTISYSLDKISPVKIGVYNMGGQLLIKLAENEQSAGEHQVQLDASKLASGIYICKVTIGNQSKSIKIMNVK